MNDSARSRLDLATTLPAPPPLRFDEVALFLDIDGTLVDFAAHPDAVVVEPALPDTLRTLRQRLGGALALVSGRPLKGIDALLDLPDIAAAGMHGGELRGAGDVVEPAQAESPNMPMLRKRADALAAEHPGVLIEHKPDAFALHYRNAPQAHSALQEAAQRLLSDAGPDYALQPGNHVIELKPAASNKGSALASMMKQPPFLGRTPWMIGDDLTDEHAFERAKALGGVAVIVGPRRPTQATHALSDPAAARTWLTTVAMNAATEPHRDPSEAPHE